MCCFFRICLRLILTCKLFVSIFICIATGLFVIWALLITRQVLPPYLTTESDSKVTNTGSRDVSIDYEDNMKYVLLWSHSDYAPFYYFTEDAFKKNNCSFTNCYVTDNQTYFGGDLSKFHAIAFNGRILDAAMVNTPRWPHQKFIFFNTESSSIYKISNYFNGFFNWTATYRLNSDIVYPYMIIKDQFGKIVGPKLDMRWEPNMKEVDKEMQVRLLNKTKLAIAFVSNCNSQSQREKVWYRLNTALEARGYKIDVYGKCGNYKCPKSNATCYDLVNKYYFYMALENSYATDYVSEKVVRALQHDAVPIVLGGADYSRYRCHFVMSRCLFIVDRTQIFKQFTKYVSNKSIYLPDSNT